MQILTRPRASIGLASLVFAAGAVISRSRAGAGRGAGDGGGHGAADRVLRGQYPAGAARHLRRVPSRQPGRRTARRFERRAAQGRRDRRRDRARRSRQESPPAGHSTRSGRAAHAQEQAEAERRDRRGVHGMDPAGRPVARRTAGRRLSGRARIRRRARPRRRSRRSSVRGGPSSPWRTRRRPTCRAANGRRPISIGSSWRGSSRRACSR